MPNDMEQIEARLAAYIDGALPADQRAEIEKYLAANPSHAALISELKSIKIAVAGLPREKAPAEVLDTLQSHLERQTLLEGVEETAVASRINRWPQLGAVAAMLLLTAGLGLLVYQVLPRGQSGAAELALLPPATRPNAPDAEFDPGVVALEPPTTKATEEVTEKGVGSAGVSTAAATDALHSPSAAASADARPDSPSADGAAPPGRVFASLPPPAPPAASPAAAAGSFIISGPTTRPTYLKWPGESVVITTPDPRLSRNLVAGTLAAMKRPNEANSAVTRPTTVEVTAGMPAGTDAADPAADEIALVVHGVSDADIAGLRDAAGETRRPAPATAAATTAPMSAPTLAPTSAPATSPVRDVRLVFRAAVPATRPATAPATRALP